MPTIQRIGHPNLLRQPYSTFWSLVVALRPMQWSKNGLVLAALFFSGQAFQVSDALLSIAGMLLFCAVCSGTYLANDLADIEKDRTHPTKCNRPLASGRLSVRLAVAVATILLIGGVGLGLWVSVAFGSILFSYTALTLGYSWGLKNIPLLELLVVASGFVLRGIAGAVLIDVVVTDWLLVCTFLLALFTVLCKRRSELRLLGSEKAKFRPTLSNYTPDLLDQMISAVTGAALVCYCLYAMSPDVARRLGSGNLKYSIPFVTLGLFRYLQLVYNQHAGDIPEKIFFTDKGMLLIILGWLAAVFWAIYLPYHN